MPMTPAERLLAAADLLDERAGEATESPWTYGERCVWSEADVKNGVVVSDGDRGQGGCASPADTAYIATMHPEVGKAVAGWLRALGNEDTTAEPEGPDTWYLHDRCDRYINDEIERLRCKCYPAPSALADLILASAS